MFLNILFIFWPHFPRLYSQPQGWWLIGLAVGVLIKDIACLMNPLCKIYEFIISSFCTIPASALYIFFFIQMLNSLILHLQTTSNTIFNCHLVPNVLRCSYASIQQSKSHHKSCACLIKLNLKSVQTKNSLFCTSFNQISYECKGCFSLTNILVLINFLTLISF